MTLLALPRPNEWWRASGSALLEHIYRTDPDIEDGRPRYPDDDPTIDWTAIADCVTDIGQAIAGGHIVIVDDVPHVPASQQFATLTPESARIVAGWLTDPPVADPHNSGPTNGRHRVWNTANARPEAMLPICGDSLGYATPEDLNTIDGWPEMYSADYNSIVALPWFDQRDALNQRFLAQLAQLAEGTIPDH